MHLLRRIKGYEDRYAVSEKGEIFSLRSGKRMAQSVNKDGYPVLTLYLNNTAKQFRVHRLVAEAFIPNPDNLPEVHHKDENKLNPSVDNLMWTTRSYNMELSFSKEYTLISPQGDVVNFRNMNKFCRDNNLNIGHVWRIMKGLRKSTKGWRVYEPSK